MIQTTSLSSVPHSADAGLSMPRVSTSPTSKAPTPAIAAAPARPEIVASRRLIIKLGTRLLTAPDGGLNLARISTLFAAVAGLVREGREVVLVSSGAIGLGRVALGYDRLPNRRRLRHACAAVGQAQLLNAYQRALRPFDMICGQLLINQRDFDERPRTLLLRETLGTMLGRGVLPILNENDALADDAELGDADPVFADNDRLAMLVANELKADLLVILTDVEGVYDRPPSDDGARLLGRLERGDDLPTTAGPDAAGWSRGGMRSKLEAARMAAVSGCHAVIAGGADPGAFSHLMAGEEIGTWIPAGPGLAARERWIAFAGAPRGTLHLDEGAVEALRRRGASLLPSGVRSVQGSFRRGDIVELRSPSGELIGRALSRRNATETSRKCRSQRRSGDGALIRRGNLVLFDPETI